MESLNSNLITKGEHNITFTVENADDCTGYYSTVNQTSDFGVIVISEWWGLNTSICTTADKFAAEGFRVVVPDVYRGKVAVDRESAGHLISGLSFKGAVADIKGSFDFLKSQGCKKVAVTGFCMGGALAIALATSYSDIDCVVPFYGIPDLTVFNIENIKCPVLAHFAEKDAHMGFSDVDSAKKLQIACQTAGINFTLKVWEGVDHAFMNQDSANFSLETYQSALKETVEFIMNAFSS